MSTLAATIERVKNVRKHPNADRLMLVDVLGWTIVTQAAGELKEGDLVVYFPIDSVLPPELEARIFGPDSKIKLDKGRVKTIKIRGEYSQGLIVPWSKAQTWPEFPPQVITADGNTLAAVVAHVTYAHPGKDVTQLLGVTKYTLSWQARLQIQREALKIAAGSKRKQREAAVPAVPRYTDLEHLAKHPDSFAPGELVVITEKLHGTSARYARVRPHPTGLWQKLKALVGLRPKHEFYYGSRNIEYRAAPPRESGETPADVAIWKMGSPAEVYGGIALRLGFFDPTSMRIQNDEIVYGEIVGSGIHKNYAYGAPRRTGHHKDFYVYDVKIGDRWLSHEELVVWCGMRRLPLVPVLYVGPYDPAMVDKLSYGASVLDPDTTPVREGVVVRRLHDGKKGRMVRKVVSKEFLMRNAEDGGTEDDEMPYVDPDAETAPIALASGEEDAPQEIVDMLKIDPQLHTARQICTRCDSSKSTYWDERRDTGKLVVDVAFCHECRTETLHYTLRPASVKGDAA